MGANFRSLSRTHSRAKGMKYNYATKLSGKEFLIKFYKDTTEFLRANIASLSNQVMKDIITIFNDEMKHWLSRFKCMRGYLAVLNAIKSKLSFCIPQINRKPPEYICHIEFFNNVVELINPSAIYINRNVLTVNVWMPLEFAELLLDWWYNNLILKSFICRNRLFIGLTHWRLFPLLLILSFWWHSAKL